MEAVKTALIRFEDTDIQMWCDDRTDKRYACVKHLCWGLGIEPHSQIARIKRHPLMGDALQEGIIVTRGGPQTAWGLNLEMVEYWLSSINVSSTKPDRQERVMKFQAECAHALHSYWNRGIAAREIREQHVRSPSFEERFIRLEKLTTYLERVDSLATDIRGPLVAAALRLLA